RRELWVDFESGVEEDPSSRPLDPPPKIAARPC
ncbi:putative Casein kinase I isoform gamma-1 protein, partial [Naja naja]